MYAPPGRVAPFGQAGAGPKARRNSGPLPYVRTYLGGYAARHRSSRATLNQKELPRMNPKQRIAQWIAAGALAFSLLPLGAAHAAGYDIAPRFKTFYNTHQGIRVLGNPVSTEITL